MRDFNVGDKMPPQNTRLAAVKRCAGRWMLTTLFYLTRTAYMHHNFIMRDDGSNEIQLDESLAISIVWGCQIIVSSYMDMLLPA